MTCVSAADNQTLDEIVEINANIDDTLTVDNEIGTFDELENEIVDSHENVFKLKRDYVYNSTTDTEYWDGILIRQNNLIIDGDYHTINAMGKAKIFNIEANNVTIKNINFINGNASHDNGAAISFSGKGSVENCNFTNNQATYRGGAIYFYSDGTVSNCHFTNNQAYHGGAISFSGTGTVENSVFENNTANTYDGGAIELQSEGNVLNCNFTNNKATTDGGALYSSVNVIADNCLFNNNTARFGGAIYLKEYGTIKSSIFNNNTATLYGGAIDLIENGIINNCNFTDNKADDDGGAVNIHKNGTVRMSHFENNKANKYGGAIQIQNGIIINNDFAYNSAKYGGAIYLINNVTVSNNRFTNNRVNGSGGAIFIYENGIIDQSKFEKNTAKTGGAIYNDGNLNIANSNFTENDATDGTDNVALGSAATISATNNTPEYLGPYHAAYLEIIHVNNTITYGDVFTIRVYVSSNNIPLNDGNVTIAFGEKMGTSKVENGYATIEVEKVPAGTWTTYVRYENSNYVGKAQVTVTIKQEFATITFEVENATYGESVKLLVKINTDGGLLNEGNITLTVDGRKYSSKVENGNTRIEIPNLDAGNYSTEIIFDNENFNTPPKSLNFRVYEKSVNLNIIEAENITYGEIVIIKVGVNCDDWTMNEGNITTVINGQTYTANVENGTATIIISNLDAGIYPVTVVFDGGKNYKKPTADVEFEVMPLPVELKLDADLIIYGDAMKIYANVTASDRIMNEGNISTIINGQTYIANVENGKATIEIPNLNVGIYPVTVMFDGGKNYRTASQEITLYVYPQLISLSIIEAKNITYSETAKVKVNVTAKGKAINEGNISTTINGQTYTAKVENGIAILEIPNLNAGNHSFTIIFDGGANYDKPTADIKLKVMILTVDMAVNVKDIQYGDTVKINATISANGNAMNEGVISTNINGQTYTANVENGKAIIEVSGLDAGSYECTVVYDDNGNTNSPSELIGFEISKSSVNIDINVTGITYGEQIKIIIHLTSNGTDINEGTVLTVIDKKYAETTDSKTGAIEIEHIILKMKNVTVSNGYAMIEVPALDVGSYPCTITFDGGKNLNNLTNEFAIDIVKQDSQITASNKAFVINYDGKYSITLKDIAGKVISGERVTFTLNGKSIGSAVTNTNGVATIALTAKTLQTVKSGVKSLVIKFENQNYNTSTKTVKITVNKEKTKIVAKKKTFKKGKKVKYIVILKNSKGKAVKKVKVTLKIKGKTYKAKTNSKGKAIFKIKLTKKGTFKASIKFKVNSYYKPAGKKVKLKFK